MVIQNYPQYFVGSYVKPVGTPDNGKVISTSESTTVTSFNKDSFISQKVSEGYKLDGNILRDYSSERYKVDGKKKTKDVLVEEIIVSDKGYTVKKYDIIDRDNRSPTSKLVKEEVYENNVLVYQEKIKRDSSGNVVERTEKDYVKGVEETRQYPKTTTTTTKTTEPTPFQKTGTGEGLIITTKSTGVSTVYDVSEGYDKPRVLGEGVLKTTSDIKKVEVTPTGVNIIQETKTPIREEPKTITVTPTNDTARQLYEQKFGGISPQRITETTPTGIPKSELRTREEVFGKQTFIQKLQEESQTLENKPGPIPAIKSFALGTGIVLVTTATKPSTIITGPYEFAKSLATKPFETGYEIGTQIYTSPFKFAGEQAGGYVVGRVLVKGVEAGKSQYVKVGAKEVPAEQLFSKQVLEEGKKFPTVTSTAETISKIKEANYEVITTSPQKISGTKAGEGPRAKTGLEDPGIYVTALGEGSPAFLGTSGTKGYSVTLNPIRPLLDIFRQPQATIFKAKGVELQPREVVSQPGFSTTKQFFLEEGSKTGKVYITKRSEIGQTELPKQSYTTTTGKRIIEGGTSEGEAIVPIGSRFEYTPKTTIGKIKGYEEYFKDPYTGKPTPLRRAKLLSEETGTTNLKESFTETPSSKIISGKQIVEESSRVSPEPKTPIIGKTISVSSDKSLEESYKPSSIKSSIESSNVSSIPDYSITSISKPEYYKTSITGKSTEYSLPKPSVSIPTTSTTSISKTELTSTSLYPSKKDYLPPPTKPPSISYRVKTDKKKGKRVLLFVRKAGKFEKRGLFETPGEAFKKGIEETSTTARASFKTVYEGETKPFIGGVLPQQFRTSKKDEFVVVQKAPFRISTRGEKTELQRAKMQKRLI